MIALVPVRRNPREIRLIGWRPGGPREERQLMESIAEYRIRGEWFEPADAVKTALQS